MIVTIPEIKGIGESKVTFKVKVTQEYNGEIKNIAVVTDPNDPDKPIKPEIPIEVVDGAGKLEAEKLVNHTVVKPGDTVTYTIKAKNILDQTILKNILVEDEIPEGLELDEESIELDGKSVVNEGNENQLAVTIPEIKGIGESKVTFKAKVIKIDSGEIKNIAVVTDPNDPEEPQKPEIEIEVVEMPGVLQAKKTVSQSIVKPGDVVTYKIAAKNTLKGSVLNNILIEDDLPDGVEFIEGSLRLGDEKVENEGSDKQIKVTIPEIIGVSEKHITFQVKVTKTTNGIVKNIAVVTDPKDPEEPKKPEVPVEVIKNPGQLDVEKLADKQNITPGDTLTYTLIARNTLANSVLKQVVIEDTLPKYVTLVPGTLKLDGKKVSNEGSNNHIKVTAPKITGLKESRVTFKVKVENEAKDNNVKVTIPEIKGIGESKVTFQAKVLQETAGTIKNIAIVTDPSDPENPAKPEIPFTVTEIPGKLVAEKTVNNETVKPDGILTYTLLAKNTVANSTLKNIVIDDKLPDGLTLIADSIKLNGEKVENEAKGNNVKVTVATIKGSDEAKVTFNVKVSNDASGTITNVALITDPNEPSKPKTPSVDVVVEDEGSKDNGGNSIGGNNDNIGGKPNEIVTPSSKEDKPALKEILPQLGVGGSSLLTLGLLLITMATIFMYRRRKINH